MATFFGGATLTERTVSGAIPGNHPGTPGESPWIDPENPADDPDRSEAISEGAAGG
jgi:hypothetical protein